MKNIEILNEYCKEYLLNYKTLNINDLNIKSIYEYEINKSSDYILHERKNEKLYIFEYPIISFIDYFKVSINNEDNIKISVGYKGFINNKEESIFILKCNEDLWIKDQNEYKEYLENLHFKYVDYCINFNISLEYCMKNIKYNKEVVKNYYISKSNIEKFNL